MKILAPVTTHLLQPPLMTLSNLTTDANISAALHNSLCNSLLHFLYWDLARWSGSVGLVLFSSSARHSWHRNDLHSGWDSSRGVYAYGTAWSELFPDWKKA